MATAGGPSAFQSFLRGNARRHVHRRAPIPKPSATSTCSCASTASSSTRRTPGGRARADGRLRRALFAVSADDGQEQPAGHLRPVDVQRRLRAAVCQRRRHADRPHGGDLLVGIIQAGVNSPYGDGIYEFKKDSIQPRIGVAWDLSGDGDTILRGAYGIYYDQPLVGIFEQNSFTMPPIVNNVTFTNPPLANPAGGQTPTTTGVRTIIATGTDFDNPRMMQWNVGVTRRLARGCGRSQLRRQPRRQPDSPDRHQLSAAGARSSRCRTRWPARSIRRGRSGRTARSRFRETTARSRYHGLLTALGRGGTHRQRDAQLHAEPQPDRCHQRSRRDRHPAEPGESRCGLRRRAHRSPPHLQRLLHLRVAVLPRRGGVQKAVLGGWQVAGIVNITSGQPVPRVLVGDQQLPPRRVRRSGRRPDGRASASSTACLLVQPECVRAAGRRHVRQLGPRAVPPAGRHQWDITLSKNFYPTETMRLQFRAEFINAFDQRQWLADPTSNGIDNTCTVSTTACNVASDRFGQILATRAPREIQFGLKLYW